MTTIGLNLTSLPHLSTLHSISHHPLLSTLPPLPDSVASYLPPAPYPQILLPLLTTLSISPYSPTDHLQAVVKPLCSISFLLPAPSPASALSLLGDLLLIATPPDSLRFKAGMAAFAGAHVAYSWMFLEQAAALNVPVLAGTVAAVGGMYAALERWGLGLLRKERKKDMTWMVRGYAGVIAGMVGVATATAGSVVGGGKGGMLGAWAFLASDVCVAVDCFGGMKEGRRKAVRVVGWWLYFWGQMLLGKALMSARH